MFRSFSCIRDTPICALVAARPPSCLDLDKSLTEVATARCQPRCIINCTSLLARQLSDHPWRTVDQQRQVGHRRSYLLWFSREREVRSIRAQVRSMYMYLRLSRKSKHLLDLTFLTVFRAFSIKLFLIFLGTYCLKASDGRRH